jgi:hypothetical protein
MKKLTLSDQEFGHLKVGYKILTNDEGDFIIKNKNGQEVALCEVKYIASFSNYQRFYYNFEIKGNYIELDLDKKEIFKSVFLMEIGSLSVFENFKDMEKSLEESRRAQGEE